MPDIRMVDLNDVNVEITTDGRTLWVNIDGVCALRVNDPKMLVIDDKRTQFVRTAQSR